MIKSHLGVIFKNENENSEMMDILRQFHSYLPRHVSEDKLEDDTQFDPQLFAGDQLSVERATNVKQSVSNGFTAEDRLEGITLQLGDWHTGLKILSVCIATVFFVYHHYNCCSSFLV